MSLNDLPTWILWLIAQESTDVYRMLIRVSRKLGLWSLKNQETIQTLFTIKTDFIVANNMLKHTKYELCGKLHRINGPAIESIYGREWYLRGKSHREDGPACEYSDGSKFWHLNGQLHRIDGPACEYSDGRKEWYFNGKLHREDGPACENFRGRREWYFDGKLHRGDGPAIESIYGREWWING